jgi:predicted nucleotidyltransferase
LVDILSQPASSLTNVKSIRQTLQENKVEIDALVEKHHGVSVSVFGSVARGEETEASDIDLLVEFGKGSSLFDLLHLQEDLQALLGRKVDVVSSGGLKGRDDHIRREAVSL